MEMSLTPMAIAKPDRTKTGFQNQPSYACKSNFTSTSAGKIGVDLTSDFKFTWQQAHTELPKDF